MALGQEAQEAALATVIGKEYSQDRSSHNSVKTSDELQRSFQALKVLDHRTATAYETLSLMYTAYSWRRMAKMAWCADVRQRYTCTGS